MSPQPSSTEATAACRILNAKITLSKEQFVEAGTGSPVALSSGLTA